jgi:malate dehydrogenase (oxaloacetate-decarboxylating)(NADP+)
MRLIEAHSIGDYDTAYPAEVRRLLRTYGLVPPVVEDYQQQADRCKQ